MRRPTFRKPNHDEMPWYYYVIAIVIMLVVAYIGLYLAGEVEGPMDFLLNLKDKRYRQ